MYIDYKHGTMSGNEYQDIHDRAILYLEDQEDWIETYDLRMEAYQSGFSKEEVAECITRLRNNSRVAIIYNSEERKEYIQIYEHSPLTDLMQKELNNFGQIIWLY